MEGTLSGQVTLSDLNGWIPEMLPSPEKVKSVQSASINVAQLSFSLLNAVLVHVLELKGVL